MISCLPIMADLLYVFSSPLHLSSIACIYACESQNDHLLIYLICLNLQSRAISFIHFTKKREKVKLLTALSKVTWFQYWLLFMVFVISINFQLYYQVALRYSVKFELDIELLFLPCLVLKIASLGLNQSSQKTKLNLVRYFVDKARSQTDCIFSLVRFLFRIQ